MHTYHATVLLVSIPYRVHVIENPRSGMRKLEFVFQFLIGFM